MDEDIPNRFINNHSPMKFEPNNSNNSDEVMSPVAYDTSYSAQYEPYAVQTQRNYNTHDHQNTGYGYRPLPTYDELQQEAYRVPNTNMRNNRLEQQGAAHHRNSFSNNTHMGNFSDSEYQNHDLSNFHFDKSFHGLPHHTNSFSNSQDSTMGGDKGASPVEDYKYPAHPSFPQLNVFGSVPYGNDADADDEIDDADADADADAYDFGGQGIGDDAEQASLSPATESGSDFNPDGQEEEEDEDSDSDYTGSSKSPVKASQLVHKNYKSTKEAQPVSGYHAIIKDQAQYLKLKTERRKNEIKDIRPSDAGIPDPECPDYDSVCLEWVKKIYNAIKNVDDISDKPSARGELAQGARRILANHYPDRYVEIKCWDVLMDTMDAAKGHKLSEPFHNTKWEDHKEYPTFSERMEAVIDALKYSKAACKQLLDPEYRHRLVDAPNAEVQMKAANARLNKARDIQNAVGRKALNGHQISPGELEKFRLETPKGKGRGGKATKGGGAQSQSDGFSYTPEALTSASVKRKRNASARATGKGKTKSTAKEDSDNENISDSDFVSPSKKKRSQSTQARAKRSVPFKSIAVVDDETVASRRTARSAAVNRRKSAGAVGDSDSKQASSQETSDYMQKLSEKYRLTICRVLGVSEKFGKEKSPFLINLHDLRIYARAYNKECANDVWKIPRGPDGYIANGPMLSKQAPGALMENNKPEMHIAEFFQQYKALAKERGDLPHKKSVPYKMFKSDKKSLTDKALGIVKNEFDHFG